LEHAGDEVSLFALRVHRRQNGDDRSRCTQERPRGNAHLLRIAEVKQIPLLESTEVEESPGAILEAR
jgi:hypothetical protein